LTLKRQEKRKKMVLVTIKKPHNGQVVFTGTIDSWQRAALFVHSHKFAEDDKVRPKVKGIDRYYDAKNHLYIDIEEARGIKEIELFFKEVNRGTD
jgi:hypothetical protein